MDTLTHEQIEAALADLDGWSYRDGALHRDLRFPTFRDAIGFIDRVAEVAEELNHHPDLSNSYTKVTVRLTTHSEGGVTDRDVALARRIDRLV